MDEPDGGVVLLDAAPGETVEFDRSLLERMGHPVTVCSGPASKTLCPLLRGEGCSKFESARGIVFQLDVDRPQHRAILRRYRELARPDLPMRVVVTPEQAARHAAALEDFKLLTHEPCVAELDGFAAEVEAADRLRES